MAVKIINGDCRDVLGTLPDKSVNCCVTSPPYFGLRDYGVDGQIGLEQTPDAFVAEMVAVFREVRRVLRDDGTLWLNLGDSYAGGGTIGRNDTAPEALARRAEKYGTGQGDGSAVGAQGTRKPVSGLKAKDLIGIPWRVAFALQQPWTDWQIKSEAMRAWVAGIVDGEGCISILRTKSSHSESLSFPPIIQVRMCDREPLDRLVHVVGSKIGSPQLPPAAVAANQRASWQWKVVSDQAAKVIAEIYPFITCKRKQAVVAWNHQMFRAARGNQVRRAGDLEKEEFCKALINDLNQRRHVDLPSWMLEPTIVQEPGWYLRQDLIWSKPNPMPESVQDRCTKAHEYIFMLSKSARYFYDIEAIKESASEVSIARSERADLREKPGWSEAYGGNPPKGFKRDKQRGHSRRHAGFNDRWDAMERDEQCSGMRNKRSVWTVATQPFREAHFATFPPDLIEPCIKAGCPVGGTVLDPFGGAGTTGLVADRLQRNAVLIELNPAYVEIARNRLSADAGMFSEVA